MVLWMSDGTVGVCWYCGCVLVLWVCVGTVGV